MPMLCSLLYTICVFKLKSFVNSFQTNFYVIVECRRITTVMLYSLVWIYSTTKSEIFRGLLYKALQYEGINTCFSKIRMWWEISHWINQKINVLWIEFWQDLHVNTLQNNSFLMNCIACRCCVFIPVVKKIPSNEWLYFNYSV